MAYQSDPHLVVAHALHVKGFGTVEDLAHLTGMSEPAVESQLVPMLEQGLAQFKEARGLWMPTPEGKQVAADLVSRELKESGCEGDMREAYPAFLDLNVKFKELCGDWQLFPGEHDKRAPNDHSDAAYDAEVVARLVDLDRHAQGVCVAFSDQLSRYAPYAPRLTVSLEKLQAGDQKQFTGVMCGSYHDVWMELHQDLLLTLGIDRGAEGSY
ncbi:MAG TPA: hypothetical protein VMK16_03260 [Acidimicrobiales bacterium]|nr:hypothetical protein [Acidimicrobiales bacterium]